MDDKAGGRRRRQFPFPQRSQQRELSQERGTSGSIRGGKGKATLGQGGSGAVAQRAAAWSRARGPGRRPSFCFHDASWGEGPRQDQESFGALVSLLPLPALQESWGSSAGWMLSTGSGCGRNWGWRQSGGSIRAPSPGPGSPWSLSLLLKTPCPCLSPVPLQCCAMSHVQPDVRGSPVA